MAVHNVQKLEENKKVVEQERVGSVLSLSRSGAQRNRKQLSNLNSMRAIRKNSRSKQRIEFNSNQSDGMSGAAEIKSNEDQTAILGTKILELQN